MRPDMKHIITETRVRRAKDTKRRFNRNPKMHDGYEDYPVRCAMRHADHEGRFGVASRGRTAPVRAFLATMEGRDWATVYSAISKGATGSRGRRLRQVVGWLVDPVEKTVRWGYGRRRFFIDPNRILRAYERNTPSLSNPDPFPDWIVPGGATKCYARAAGNWYEVTLAPGEPPVFSLAPGDPQLHLWGGDNFEDRHGLMRNIGRDLWLYYRHLAKGTNKTPSQLWPAEWGTGYYPAVYAIAKRQVSRKEISRLGLRACRTG